MSGDDGLREAEVAIAEWRHDHADFRSLAEFVAAYAEQRARERAAEERAERHYVGMQAVRGMPSDWYCPRSEPGRSRRDCPECVAEVALDAALAADDRTGGRA